MARRDLDRLKAYLAMVSKKSGGVEAVLERVKSSAAGATESTEAPGREGSAAPANEAAQSALEAIERDKDVNDEQYSALEAIINADLRPTPLIIDGTYDFDDPTWSHLSRDSVIKARITGKIPSVGRIELPGNAKGLPFGGTGFVVGDGLLMTNRHVAEIFAAGLGDRRIDFLPGAKARIDFCREFGKPAGRMLDVVKVVMIHPYWDLAILEVKGLGGAHTPLNLSLDDARDMTGRDIFVIGYPFYDPRNPAGEQNQLFDGKYGVKRLQPGQLQGAIKVGSFGKTVAAASHDCSTLGGNSGSAVFDLDSGKVLALHFGGRYHERNYCVPTCEMSRDTRIVDAGVQFAGKAPGNPNDWAAWWRRADAGEGESVAGDDAPAAAAASTSTQPSNVATRRPPAPVRIAPSAGAVTIEVPLRITIELGAPAAGAHAEALASAVATSADDMEALKEPLHDTDYSTRKGYDPKFLGVAVPMPKAKEPGAVAMTKDGKDVLHYQNFSVRMHAKRRLALVTASNITREANLRRPEPNRDYSRKGLTGLGKNDQERWYLDDRLDEKFQLPDVFFTKDRGAFDKGHIVRREDVAWGRTYDELVRANGDSFHVTNCSPQVAGYNRSNLGEENWGDLENVVFSKAASERLCVIAGPVLADTDQTFVGTAGGGKALRARVPAKFWKVIVALGDDGIAAYGFVLEQDLSAVEWEFTVPGEFVPYLTRLADIEAMTGVVFDKKTKDADQAATTHGAEIARRGGARVRAG